MTNNSLESTKSDNRPLPTADVPAGLQLKGRLTLLAIVAVCVLPLLGALYFRYVSPPTVKATEGRSLSPAAPLKFEFLQRLDGSPLEHPEVSGTWLVVFAAPGACDARCQHTLYLTRQARTAQGRNVERVDRIWVVTDATMPLASLLSEHPDLIVVKATDASLMQELGGNESRAINLVDRRGMVVFRYPDDPEPKAFIRELGKLIRF